MVATRPPTLLDQATAEVVPLADAVRRTRKAALDGTIAERDARLRLGAALNCWRAILPANQEFGYLLERTDLHRNTTGAAMRTASALCDERGRLDPEKCRAMGRKRAGGMLRGPVADYTKLTYRQCQLLAGVRQEECAVAPHGVQRIAGGDGLVDAQAGFEADTTDPHTHKNRHGSPVGTITPMAGAAGGIDDGGGGTPVPPGRVANGEQLSLCWSESQANRTKRVIERVDQAVRLQMVDAAEAGGLLGLLEDVERQGLSLLHRAVGDEPADAV